jgi:hypothetical protein
MKPASESVRIHWDVSHEELMKLFDYWNNRSMLARDDVAACVEECRPSGRRYDAASAAASPLRLFVWDLEEFVRNYTRNWAEEAYKLTYDENGVAILPPLTLNPDDIVSLTEHELHVLHRRPHLMRILRKAISKEMDDFIHTVNKRWRAKRYDAEWKSTSHEAEEKSDRHAQGIYSEDERDDRDDVSIIEEEPVLHRPEVSSPRTRRLEDSWVTDASSMNEETER